MRLVWWCNLIPLAWRAYISGLFPMQSQQHQKDIRTHDQQAWNICGPYSEFKRATVACGKFKITETQNESSQSLYSWKKVPKLWQIFGKIGLGVKVPKLWRTPRARQIQETHAQTQLKDLPSDTGPGGNRTPDRPWPTVLHLLSGTLTGEKRNFPKKISLFWENQNDFPKIVVKFRPPSRGLRKHRLSLYSRRLSLYSPIFPKKVADFWENWPRETARALCVRLDRNISSNINSYIYIFNISLNKNKYKYILLIL